jgi:hypothetical protein
MFAMPCPRSWSLRQRFDHYLDRSGGKIACWPWKQAPKANGYGRLHWERKSHLVHRLAWKLLKGPIPDGLLVLHKCDNRICCNPRHLFLGTYIANVADRDAKGRQARGERGGTAKLTRQQIREIRASRTRQIDIAEAFNITQAHVSTIKRRKAWRHVP